jgi:hypothetical protein
MTRASPSVISKLALIIITVAAWLLVCLSFELHRISAFLALPPSGDMYAHTWSFQLMVFAVFRFPI